MTKRIYPDYIQQMMGEARRLLAGDTAVFQESLLICYEILALHPEHQAASLLIMEIFSEPRLIYENRQAICQTIEEWDDRPFQFRLRLAKSFQRMGCWVGRGQMSRERAVSEDVAQIVSNADRLLQQNQQALFPADEDLAWYLYRQAIAHAKHPAKLLLYAGYQYANRGFFVESAELLQELLITYGDADDALKLWAEVCWWRDHQYRLPWIPPYFPGNGRRWKIVRNRIDPQLNAKMAGQKSLQGSQAVKLLDPEIIKQINHFSLDFEIAVPDSLVDWSYLEAVENNLISMVDFPEWAQYLIKDIDDPDEEDRFVQYLLRLLSNPTNNTNHTDLHNFF